MKNWYRDYWAQTWYKNTFLVRRPGQIAQAIGNDHEWNNLHDSGCNFTCLAMIVGIDPARLASELSSRQFFFADSSLPATYLTGKTGGLVWDRNAPHGGLKSIALENIWHPQLKRRASIKVGFVRKASTTRYEEGRRLTTAIHASGHHVVCGPRTHSHLVAGTVGDEFFVWDPDDSADGTSVEDNLGGKFTLGKLFHEYAEERIEFWAYQCDVALPNGNPPDT